MKYETELKAFGLHLRKLRQEANLSQQKLADEADLAKSTIQKIEQGLHHARFDILIALASALKVKLTILVDFNRENSKE